MSSIRNAFLTAGEGSTLLKIARGSIATYLQQEQLPLERFTLSSRLREKHGLFVTLRLDGALRGCIGHIRAIAPLAAAVRENAVNAATRDPRFPPVTLEELPSLAIEVSVLCPVEVPGSPFVPVHDLSEIVLGRDGLYLDQAGPRGGGLLLPGVALDHALNVFQFVEAVCHKAGAAHEAWKHPDAQLYRFTTQTFAEEDRASTA